MGGNVKLETGERAEKINIGMMNSEVFNAYKYELYFMLNRFNSMFSYTSGKKLWQNFDELYSSGEMFSGSTRLMFKKPFNQFALYKPTVGDIDIQVPNELMNTLKVFLENNKNGQFGSFKYIGFTNVGMQLNCLFEAPDNFKMFSKYIQVDFEGTEFINGKPTEFSTFGHYSSWTDVKAGIKGFANKYLLRALVSGIYKIPNCVVLSKKTKKAVKSKPIENIFGFSVDKGFREKLEFNLDENNDYVMIDGKFSLFKIEPKDAVYITDLNIIFEKLFCASPSEDDKHALFSFVKTLYLMKMYCADSNIESVFEDFVELLWGDEAQRLERDNPSLDNEAKTVMYNKFVEVFPFLKSKEKRIKSMKNEYYENYKIS